MVGRLAGALTAQTASRAVSFVGILAVSPAVAQAYGLGALGSYATMLGALALLSAIETGLGGATRSSVVAASLADDLSVVQLRSLATALMRHSYLMVGVLYAPLVALSALVPRGAFIPPNLVSSYGWAVLPCFISLYLAGVPLQAYTRACEGVDRNGPAALAAIIPTSFVAVITVTISALGGPFLLVLLVPALTPGLHGLTTYLYLVGQGVPGRTSIATERIDLAVAAPLTIIALMNAASYSLDYWLVSSLASLEGAGLYSAAARPAQIFMVIASAASPVLWTQAVRSRATTKSGIVPGRQLAQMTCVFGLVGAACSILYLLLSWWLGDFLTAGNGQPGVETLLAFSLWGLVLIAHQPLAMSLNSAPALRQQTVSMTMMTVTNVSLSIWWIPAHGPSGAVWASVTALAGVHVPYLLWIRRRAASGVVRDLAVARKVIE